jgi:hypothetical protein
MICPPVSTVRPPSHGEALPFWGTLEYSTADVIARDDSVFSLSPYLYYRWASVYVAEAQALSDLATVSIDAAGTSSDVSIARISRSNTGYLYGLWKSAIYNKSFTLPVTSIGCGKQEMRNVSP